MTTTSTSKIAKRRRLEEKTSYEDLHYMLGTSASVDILFSMAKCTMNDKRNRFFRGHLSLFHSTSQ
ncbi:hypothetical protein PHMEG_00011817 [Phytophthora megakarya]|uniref:Uncharacterized protein n=1 Tax=Phytophthora megakarya TaxID=4795 RepID=A0A225WAC0_9STRA|nr:hypothetical protein PHMEG_00011817 [Phytophthora megakarya]